MRIKRIDINYEESCFSLLIQIIFHLQLRAILLEWGMDRISAHLHSVFIVERIPSFMLFCCCLQFSDHFSFFLFFIFSFSIQSLCSECQTGSRDNVPKSSVRYDPNFLTTSLYIGWSCSQSASSFWDLPKQGIPSCGIWIPFIHSFACWLMLYILCLLLCHRALSVPPFGSFEDEQRRNKNPNTVRWWFRFLLVSSLLFLF